MATLADSLLEIIQGVLPKPQNTGFGPTVANRAALPQPAQTPSPLPEMPNLGQPNNGGGGGGLANALMSMGKSFLGTAANTLPTALANAAIFGDNPQSRQMTYHSMLNQLEEKKEARERKRQDTVANWATFLYSMQKYGEPLGVKPEAMEMALMTGTKTGVPEIDSYLDQAREGIKPLIEQGDLGPGDMLEGMKKRAEYVKLMEGEKKKYQQVTGARGKFFNPEDPSEIITAPGIEPEIENLSEEQLTMMAQRGDNEAQAILDAMQERKVQIAHESRLPKKPDKPSAKQRVMITNPDGTMEVEGVFDSGTGVTTPVKIYDEKTKKWKPKPWRKKKEDKGKGGAPKTADEFLSKYK